MPHSQVDKIIAEFDENLQSLEAKQQQQYDQQAESLKVTKNCMLSEVTVDNRPAFRTKFGSWDHYIVNDQLLSQSSIYSRMKLTKRVCARIFRSRDRESTQYTRVRVRFNRLNFDQDTCTGYWKTFYGSSNEASFHHCIFETFSNRCQVLLLSAAMSLYNLACKIIQLY